MKIRLGSRKSDLAQIQSRLVAAKLKRRKSEIDFEYVFKDVAVDLNLDLSLVDAESKGLFTKDLSEDLIAERVDAVVHSWKDLPTTNPHRCVVVATLEREDPRDIVFIKKTSLQKKSFSLLSSSPRRELNLGAFVSSYVFPGSELKFVPVRGNLPTRMKKFMTSEEDGLVLALAAVKRLLEHGNDESKLALKQLLETSNSVVVPVTENPPAPAQGALAIEIKKDRKDIMELFATINHRQTFNDVVAERERLKYFGGGCHLKLGIYMKTTERGVLKVEKGLSPEGENLNIVKWEANKPLPLMTAEAYYDASKLDLFDRKAIAISRPEVKAIFNVSKADALPDTWLKEEDVLWVAGLESWKKLRAKGYWVSGCHESLGESFLPTPQILWPQHKHIKLSHKGAPRRPGEPYQFLATYELVRNAQPVPDLSAFEYFYWPSGSVFLECLKTNPSLLEKTHICGLGNTYTVLSKHILEERLHSVLRREECLPQ